MRIRHLKLSAFRNYRELEFIPLEGINILYGENAQGKSNILEAISLLATTRSLRASRESELIQSGAEMAHVTAEVDREREGDAELQVSVFQGEKKAVRVNGMKRDRVVDLLGQFNAVFFGSIDLPIVTGEPSDRRHYLNVEISQISPRYVYDLGHFKRILASRNRLLKDLRDRPRRPEDCGLDAWDDQLVAYGARLIEKRRFYLDRLSPLAEEIHRDLSDGRETLEVRYLPSVALPEKPLPDVIREASREDKYLTDAQNAAQSDGINTNEQNAGVTGTHPPPSELDALTDAFRSQLRGIALEELRRGTTLLGPQRDDLMFLINGTDARLFGSQGQQRTVALSLKLAEFRLIEDYVGEPPVMLLDDVMSDLDDIRRKHLLRWVQRRCQTFITCTNLRSFPKEILNEAATFKVVAGTVTPDVRSKTRSTPSEPLPVEPSPRQTVSEVPADAGTVGGAGNESAGGVDGTNGADAASTPAAGMDSAGTPEPAHLRRAEDAPAAERVPNRRGRKPKQPAVVSPE
jgi:DNA replication and repair protein RecF